MISHESCIYWRLPDHRLLPHLQGSNECDMMYHVIIYIMSGIPFQLMDKYGHARKDFKQVCLSGQENHLPPLNSLGSDKIVFTATDIRSHTFCPS